MSKKMEKIKAKASAELDIIDVVLKETCNYIHNDNDRTAYNAYWATLLAKNDNVIFDTGITDETQMYTSVVTNIKGAELYSNVDYLSKYMNASSQTFQNVELERINDTLYCQGAVVVTSRTNTAPTLKKNNKYPVLITKIDKDRYLVIDGNHRVNSGETKAIIVPTLLYMKSFVTLYEVYMYLMYTNLGNYLYNKMSVEDIITYNTDVINRVIGNRLLR